MLLFLAAFNSLTWSHVYAQLYSHINPVKIMIRFSNNRMTTGVRHVNTLIIINIPAGILILTFVAVCNTCRVYGCCANICNKSLLAISSTVEKESQWCHQKEPENAKVNKKECQNSSPGHLHCDASHTSSVRLWFVQNMLVNMSKGTFL